MTDEAALAMELASEAGRLLLDLRSDAIRRELPIGSLRSAADERSHEFLVRALRDAFPGDAILSEEGKDDPDRHAAKRVWIIDPLDGTREYGEGRDDWAIHVAFWMGGELAAGAVALPGQGRTLSTAAPPTPPPPLTGKPRLVVSRTRPPQMTEHIRARLGADLIPMGSAGAKAMAVVQGLADVYAHAGGQHEWDSAAPVAVAAAAGLHTSRIDGSPLVYNQRDPWLPDVLICRPELADAVIAVGREPQGEHGPLAP